MSSSIRAVLWRTAYGSRPEISFRAGAIEHGPRRTGVRVRPDRVRHMRLTHTEIPTPGRRQQDIPGHETGLGGLVRGARSAQPPALPKRPASRFAAFPIARPRAACVCNHLPALQSRCNCRNWGRNAGRHAPGLVPAGIVFGPHLAPCSSWAKISSTTPKVIAVWARISRCASAPSRAMMAAAIARCSF